MKRTAAGAAAAAAGSIPSLIASVPYYGNDSSSSNGPPVNSWDDDGTTIGARRKAQRAHRDTTAPISPLESPRLIEKLAAAPRRSYGFSFVALLFVVLLAAGGAIMAARLLTQRTDAPPDRTKWRAEVDPSAPLHSPTPSSTVYPSPQPFVAPATPSASPTTTDIEPAPIDEDQAAAPSLAPVDQRCMDDLGDPTFQAALRERGRRNLFFIRTSSEKSLSTVDMCSVASAVEQNPDAHVMVLSQTLTCKALRRISRSPMLRIVRFEYASVFSHVPSLAGWYASKVWQTGYHLNNKGNALRLALLYLYGGSYYDTDMLVLGSTSDLSAFIAMEREGTLNNAVLGFPMGHPFVAATIERFVDDFKGRVWGHNGPALMKRAWEEVGGSLAGTDLHNTVEIRPQHEFYFITYALAKDLFAPALSPKGEKWFKDWAARGPPRAVHLWNKLTKGYFSKIGRSAKEAAAAAADGVGSDVAAAGALLGSTRSAGSSGSAAEDALASAALSRGEQAGSSSGSTIKLLVQPAPPPMQFRDAGLRRVLVMTDATDNSGGGSSSSGANDATAMGARDGGVEEDAAGEGDVPSGGSTPGSPSDAEEDGSTASSSAAALVANKGPMLVEVIMAQACPAFLTRNMPELIPFITRAVAAAPPGRFEMVGSTHLASLPIASSFLRTPVWLSWPSTRLDLDEGHAEPGTNVALPAKGRVRGGRRAGNVPAAPVQQVAGLTPAEIAAALASAASAAGPTAGSGGKPVYLFGETGARDCGAPSGSAAHMLCGAVIPLPFQFRGSYSWTISLWVKASVGMTASPHHCRTLGCASAGAVLDGVSGGVSGIDDDDSTCATARLGVDGAPVGVVSLRLLEGNISVHFPNGRRLGAGSSGRKLAVDASAAGGEYSNSSETNGGGGDTEPDGAAEGGDATLDTPPDASLYGGGITLFPYRRSGKPHMFASDSWRHVAILYSTKFWRRADPASGEVEIISNADAWIYVDGLFAERRHAASAVLTSVSVPQFFVIGGSGAGEGDSELLIDGVSVHASKLNEQGLLEQRNHDVDDAIEHVRACREKEEEAAAAASA